MAPRRAPITSKFAVSHLFSLLFPGGPTLSAVSIASVEPVEPASNISSTMVRKLSRERLMRFKTPRELAHGNQTLPVPLLSNPAAAGQRHRSALSRNVAMSQKRAPSSHPLDASGPHFSWDDLIRTSAPLGWISWVWCLALFSSTSKVETRELDEVRRKDDDVHA